MRPLRVAVVGTGAWWGREHARVFSRRPDTELCAVVGRSASTVEARAREFGTAGYTDLAEMLAAQQPDLVSVCLPNEAHFDPTLQLIRAGVPLLVEKPLVFDLAQADQLLAEAKARELFLAINFNHRYATPVQLTRTALDQGRLGPVVFATWRFGGEPNDGKHPHRNLIETQCHGFDLLEHLCGPISAVSAELTDGTGRDFSTVAIALRFARRRRHDAGHLRFVVRVPRRAPGRGQRHAGPGRHRRPRRALGAVHSGLRDQ